MNCDSGSDDDAYSGDGTNDDEERNALVVTAIRGVGGRWWGGMDGRSGGDSADADAAESRLGTEGRLQARRAGEDTRRERGGRGGSSHLGHGDDGGHDDGARHDGDGHVRHLHTCLASEHSGNRRLLGRAIVAHVTRRAERRGDVVQRWGGRGQ